MIDAATKAPRLTAIVVALLCASNCSRAVRQVPSTTGTQPPIEQLWIEPTDISARDLFYGPGGRAAAPAQDTFEFLDEEVGGFSRGYDVRDDQGLEWGVKVGPEAQTEVVTSRVLWAIGFHQPPTYFLSRWELKGARTGVFPPGRFRPKLPTMKVVGDWSWYENPFVGTRPFHGLVVANLIMTNWDWKASNNKIYEIRDKESTPTRQYVVRDLGASLGKFTQPIFLQPFRLRGFGQGTRNDLRGFEQQGFIKRVNDGDVDFHYRGVYRDVVNSVRPPDVIWATQLLARLSDAQWNDAFRAGGYSPDQARRFIKRIKEKIAEGLAIDAAARGYRTSGSEH